MLGALSYRVWRCLWCTVYQGSRVKALLLYIARANKKDDPTFAEELKQVFATLSLLMGYQENKVKDVYLVQVRNCT